MSNENATLTMNENVNDTTKVLPFQINYIPEFVRKIAEEELNDSPENRRKGLEELKELLNDHKMTKGIEFEDDFLLGFLLCNKFNADVHWLVFDTYLTYEKITVTFFVASSLILQQFLLPSL
ncbi:hypothetical protein TNIN_170611 [Trichonephila inaurata madagascariensis]|uniref:Uncharacterized protein n=1 Tax=Trichonephila inaurata madagascariensis TaxID=2747483 RepID=A0A8X6X8L0_9ARAC|nr:hypothetical protein TNIN_170611 [Trichonephila inaurata madagascariensis]